MRFSKFMSVVVVAGLMLSSATAGTLKGNVNYQGEIRKKKTLKMDADPICGSSHKGKVFNESFLVDDKNNLANVMVWLKDVKYTGKVKEISAIIDQKGCLYSPHVQGIMKDQELLIKNSDATLHNIHSMAKDNKQFNFAMPKVVKEKKVSFNKTEDPFYIKCDVHPWMKAWIGVFDHPYFAVTDENGDYKIDNIPPGTYKIMFWQERLSNLSEKFIEVSNEKSIEILEDTHTLDYTFPEPEKKKK